MVALKFLPLSLHDQETALERFVAEARAASALDHPNICTIYEIGETDSGETFIAMAYYDGETLKDRIRRGAMSAAEAGNYAIQISHGLAKAHAAGIVHRDIKPANVMITSDGIVKILDFGLARVEGQQLTRTGELLGTLDYMSPEQVEGGTADARSDVWSVGAILFEMLMGQRPFVGESQAAVLYAVLHDEPPDVSVTNTHIPVEVAAVVRRCLDKDAAERFSDAGDLLATLETTVPSGMRGVAPVSFPPGTFQVAGETATATSSGPSAASAAVPAPEPDPSPHSKFRKAGLAAVGVAALGLLALSLPATRTAISELFAPGSAIASSNPFVAVIPSSSGIAEDSILAEGLTHVLTSELARFDSLSVLAAAEIVKQPDRTPSEIHRLYNLDAIVTVAIERVGGNRVRVTLVDPTTMQERASVPLPMPDSMGFAVFQDSAPKALASLLGIGQQPPPRALAVFSDYRAFDYYAQGRAYLARYHDRANLEYAVQLFNNALDIDPLFAPAHAGICEARFEQFRVANDTTLVTEARPSCDEAIRLGADQVEVLVPVASVYLRTGDPEEARSALMAAIAKEPLNADARRWLARVDDEVGDETAARFSYEEAIQLNPRQWEYHHDYAGFLVYHGEHAASVPHWEEVRKLAPDNFMGDLGLSATLIWLDRIDDAEALLRPLVERRVHERAFSNMGYLYFRAGRYADGVRVLEDGLEDFQGDPWVWRWLAHNAHWAGDEGRADEAWRQVVDICGARLAVNARDIDCLSALAEAHAQLGDERLARQYLDRFVFEPKKWDFHVYDLGRTLEMLGSRTAALQRIGEAVQQGWDLATVESDPWLAELRGDAGFGVRVAERVSNP